MASDPVPSVPPVVALDFAPTVDNLPMPVAEASVPGDAQKIVAPSAIAHANLKRGLTIGRIYYFVFFFGLAAQLAFINVYFESLGISPTQMGLIGAATALVGMIVTPMWSAAADARQWHRALMVFAALACGTVGLAFLGVTAFWGALVVSVLVAILRAPIPPVLDSSVVIMVRQTAASYPRQRVWGSVGFAAGAFLVSLLVSRTGFGSIFWVHFIAFAIVGTVLSLLLPIERTGEKIDYFGGLRVLLGLPHYRGQIVFMMGLGIVTATGINFGGIYILSLGGTAATIGLMYTLAGLVEIPAMLSGDVVTGKLGLRGAMVISGFGIALLNVLAGFAPSAYFYVAIAIVIGGFTGVIWSAVAPLAMRDAPPQLRATALGIVFAAFGGAGFAIGVLLAGIVLDAFGGGAHFFSAAFLMLLATAYFYFSSRD